MSLLSINDYAIGRDYSNNIDDTNVVTEYKKLLKPLLEHFLNTVGLTFTNNV